MARLIAHLAWADEDEQQAYLDAYRELVLPQTEVLGQPQDPDRLRGRSRPAEPDLAAAVKADALVWPNGMGESLLTMSARGPSRTWRGGDRVNSAGNQFTSRADDILLQIFLHGTHHRGRSRAFRIAGQEPNPTDYIAFIRGAPAATRQDSIKRP